MRRMLPRGPSHFRECCDGGEKVGKIVEYEGKTRRCSFSASTRDLVTSAPFWVFSGWAGVIVILSSPVAAKLFTSYSHPLCPSLPAA